MDSGELFQYGPESSFNTPGLGSIHRVFLGVYFRLNCSSLTAGNILVIFIIQIILVLIVGVGGSTGCNTSLFAYNHGQKSLGQ